MTNPNSEYQTIISKIDLLNEKLELYKKLSDQQQENTKEYINSIRAEVKAFQDANKQQLNVSLGVLVTAAIAILVSVVISR